VEQEINSENAKHSHNKHLKQQSHTLFITSKEHDEDGGWPGHVTNN